jgi:hypothetical protein
LELLGLGDRVPKKTADLSTTLRSGRDDKLVWVLLVAFPGQRKQQVPPLRYAPVGMTRLLRTPSGVFLRLNHNGWGFAPSFSAHVRWGERGAPVCSYGFSTQAAGAVYLGEEGGAY